jgi:hypothetical protein
MADRKQILIKNNLARFAAQLRQLVDRETKRLKLKLLPRSIDADLADLVASAIVRYITGEPSLDRALGLVRSGRPSRAGKDFAFARDQIGWRLAQGLSFKKITRVLDSDHYTEEHLRDIWKRERVYVMQEYARRGL